MSKNEELLIDDLNKFKKGEYKLRRHLNTSCGTIKTHKRRNTISHINQTNNDSASKKNLIKNQCFIPMERKPKSNVSHNVSGGSLTYTMNFNNNKNDNESLVKTNYDEYFEFQEPFPYWIEYKGPAEAKDLAKGAKTGFHQMNDLKSKVSSDNILRMRTVQFLEDDRPN